MLFKELYPNILNMLPATNLKGENMIIQYDTCEYTLTEFSYAICLFSFIIVGRWIVDILRRKDES